MKILEEFLKVMVEKEASDLFISSNSPPYLKIHGRMHMLCTGALPSKRVKAIADSLMSPEQITMFESQPELNLGLSLGNIGRFRINIFQQRNELGLVIRHIKTCIPAFDSLGLPEVLKQLIMIKRVSLMR